MINHLIFRFMFFFSICIYRDDLRVQFVQNISLENNQTLPDPPRRPSPPPAGGCISGKLGARIETNACNSKC